MALQITPTAYKPRAAQATPVPSTQYLQQELERISVVTNNLALMIPQVATKAPAVVSDGMIRLARSPWRPVAGTTTDAWVFWDAVHDAWALL